MSLQKNSQLERPKNSIRLYRKCYVFVCTSLPWSKSGILKQNSSDKNPCCPARNFEQKQKQSAEATQMYFLIVRPKRAGQGCWIGALSP